MSESLVTKKLKPSCPIIGRFLIWKWSQRSSYPSLNVNCNSLDLLKELPKLP